MIQIVRKEKQFLNYYALKQFFLNCTYFLIRQKLRTVHSFCIILVRLQFKFCSYSILKNVLNSEYICICIYLTRWFIFSLNGLITIFVWRETKMEHERFLWIFSEYLYSFSVTFSLREKNVLHWTVMLIEAILEISGYLTKCSMTYIGECYFFPLICFHWKLYSGLLLIWAQHFWHPISSKFSQL